MNEIILMKDFMTKRSRMKKKYIKIPHFNNRWFELTETSLNYYDGDLEKGPGHLKGTIMLSNVSVIETASGLNKNYMLQVGHKIATADGYKFCTLYISCVHKTQQEDWIKAIRQACISRGCTFKRNYHEGVWQKNGYTCCGSDENGCEGCKTTTSTNSQLSTLFKWYYVDFSKLQAKELLKKDGREGCFLVRDSKKAGVLVLVVQTKNSMKLEDKQGTGTKQILQFHINCDDKNNYFILKTNVFKSVADLIEYYQCNSSGLPCRLKCYPRDCEDFSDSVSEVINSEDLQIKGDIGCGQFGVVTKAIYKSREVAVKQLKNDMDDQDFKDEARFMMSFDHPNLVKLLGICLTKPIKIVTEFMKHGALIQFLKRNKDNMSLDLMKNICLQVCSGMKYLENKKIIHRDLAARNCLVGEKEAIKICDFGLSRRVMDKEYNSSSDFYFSIRWSSPESLTSRTFSSKSDVWSFGIVMWEVFSCGKTPYPNIKNNKDVREFICTTNQMLPRPEICPLEAYKMMQHCWKFEPDRRPSFDQLLDNFETQIYGEDDDLK